MDEYHNQEINITSAVAVLQALDNTGICLFMYYPQTKSIFVPEKTCATYHCKSVYENMPHSFADDFVHEDDYATFKNMYDKIDQGENNTHSVFHSKDLNYCCGVTLTVVTRTEDGRPKEVFGIIENISEAYKSNALVKKMQQKIGGNENTDASVQEAINLIAGTISDAYLTIYHIWLEDITYVCFQDETTNYAQSRGNRIPCNPKHVELYIAEIAEPEYAAVLQEFYRFDTLQERLKDTEHMECIYKTKNHGWTKGQYIVAKRDKNGNALNVIFTVRDINEEIKREEQKQQTMFELLHDPLTKVYNRKGFEKLSQESRKTKRPIGFAILDIDEFKGLNDTYGHEVGDQILKKVAASLVEVFRNEDRIFRLGGDEFAVILNNYTKEGWNAFQRKQENIHRLLHKQFSQMKGITLSIGVSFSETGYSNELYTLADEALYETKNNGRAGCTLINRDHRILGRWRDENFTIQTEEALDRSTTGVYRMIFPKDAEEAPKMYCNETTKMILGVDTNATPEQCYAIWEKGIDSSYYEALKETREIMLAGGQAECTYRWNHPVWGTIYVRSGGFGKRENGEGVLHGYHHALKNTTIIERQDDSKLLVSAMSNVYFCMYYLDLDNNTYSTFKIAPGEDHLQMQNKTISEILTEFINVLVMSEDQEKMRDFTNLDTLQERIDKEKMIDCEYRSQALKGWCRARFIPIKYDQNGKLTHVLFAIASLDATKARELEVIKKAMDSYEERLRSLLSTQKDTLSLCMINVTQDTFKMVDVEGVMEQFIDETASMESTIMRAADYIVDAETQKEYRRVMSREYLLEQAAKGNMHVQIEYLIQLAEHHYEWVTAAVDMIQNPVNGEIAGVAYSKSTQNKHMSEMLLEKTLQQDYLFAALIFADTDEFYLYNSAAGKFSTRMENYWKVALADSHPRCSDETLERLRALFHKEYVLKKLEEQQEVSFAFESYYNGTQNRLEIKFCYLDESRTMLLASMRNITDELLLDQLRHDSEHDALTDLYNRKTIFRKSRELMDAHPDEQFVIVHVDMKHFRMYNTFFGDKAGDQLLCDIADLFRWMDADYDHWVYGRIEGDVFCACFPFQKKIYDKHLQSALEMLKNYRQDFLIEPTLGLYFVTDRSIPVESMFVRATMASKYVQPDTVNATVVYDEEMEMQLKEEQQITNEMQIAMEQEQFKVYLQPKYALRTNKLVGAEALVRWFHPDRGIVSPATFIPVYEKNGFIAELDRYMWEHVCQLIRKWMDEGKNLLPVSVNVSRISMFSPATVQFLKGLIEKYEIDPRYLELELTESAYIDDPEEMQIQMNALREAGFKILLDDFGSGYSSLTSLRELPVDILKLDMKFLSKSEHDTRGSAVLSSIIRMSKLLNLAVIAEGVETAVQADFLRSIGCEYVQGYLFARPMQAEDYESLMLSYAVPYEEEKLEDTTQLKRLLTDISEASRIIGNTFPVPIVVVEYEKGAFSYLRANISFISEFGLNEDLRPGSKVFQEHMSEKDFAYMVKAYRKCVETKKQVCFKINWTDNDNTTCVYLCRAVYQGRVGVSEIMLVTFTNASIPEYL